MDLANRIAVWWATLPASYKVAALVIVGTFATFLIAAVQLWA